MSRGDYRPIYAVLLDSPEYEDLSRDGSALLIAVKLSLGPSGIGVLSTDLLMRRSKLSGLEDFAAARDELIATGWIQVERHVWWLRNGLRFEPTMSLENDNHRKSIERHLLGLPKLAIVNRMAAYYGLPEPFPTLNGNGYRMASPMGSERVPDPMPIPMGITEPLTEPLTLTEPEPEPETEDRGVARTRDEPPGRPVSRSDAAHGPNSEPPNGGEQGDPADGLEGMLAAYPAADAALGRIEHLAGRDHTEATLRHRFLYPDPDPGLGDPAVKGLPLPERQQLVACALVEFPTPWDRPLFTGYVRRLREQGARFAPVNGSSPGRDGGGGEFVILDRNGNRIDPKTGLPVATVVGAENGVVSPSPQPPAASINGGRGPRRLSELVDKALGPKVPPTVDDPEHAERVEAERKRQKALARGGKR